MADAQFIVYNDAGVEQVSYGGYNLHCVKKIVLTAANFTAISGPAGATGVQYQFTVAGVQNPKVAIATNVDGPGGAAGVAGLLSFTIGWPRSR